MPLPTFFSGLTDGKLDADGFWEIATGLPAPELGVDSIFMGVWIGRRILPEGSSGASA